MENNFIQMADTAGHAVAYTIDPISTSKTDFRGTFHGNFIYSQRFYQHSMKTQVLEGNIFLIFSSVRDVSVEI